MYPNVTTEEWLERHQCFKALSAKATCICSERSVGFRAFVTDDYAGIEASRCICGRAGINLMTPTNDIKKRKWNTLFYGLARDVSYE